MDINFKFNDITLNVRVAGIYIKNNKVLFNRHKDSTFYNLPGGRIKLGESSSNALIREYFEETNEHIEIISKPYILENFFSRNGNNYHEYLFLYIINIKSLKNLDNYSQDNQIFNMFTKEEIIKLDIRPLEVKNYLISLLSEENNG
ncbi:NUDIX hydrolase [Caviibacter abscessus]|uniref:NUDIX hydrolase n=1 Tax=Caviibacter abscessus TaxID=1766719 RepID=UPI000832B1C8|nr:NUDIX domain-containing protein [Caviibacter abscessus]